MEARLDRSFDFSVLFDEYRDEARQQLDLLDGALLTLERAGALAEEERAALLRAMHTLKGNSGMLGLAPLHDIVHRIEDVFRFAPSEWPQPLLDRLFESAAALRRAVEHAGKEGEAEAFARVAGISFGSVTAAPLADEPKEQAQEQAQAQAQAPAPAALPESEAPPEEAPAPPAAEAVPAGLDAAAELLRVPFTKLEAMVARITELVEMGDALDHLARAHRETLAAVGLWRPLLERIERLKRIADDVRAAAMELRLVPVARVFGRFPSLARELAREQGKRVQVVLEGESTELDKSTVDILGEPLLHLVRNAIDHGLEPPEEREENGKPPEGALYLRATPAGDRVRIEVEDDGRGLDRRAILARARELRLIDQDAELEPQEIDALIFHPGFTTRRKVSTLSGRGIGLDVVVSSVARLRGSLEVEPGADGGTRFVLHLPLTLLVVPALLFESEGQTLALPVIEIEETIRSATRQKVGGSEVIRHDGELLPLALPSRIFGWPRPAPAAASGNPANGGGDPERFAIVVRRGSRAAAIAADRLIEQRDVVVKPIPALLGQPHGVSGATVAPGGRVVLILDAGGLIDLNLDFHRRERRVR